MLCAEGQAVMKRGKGELAVIGNSCVVLNDPSLREI